MSQLNPKNEQPEDERNRPVWFKNKRFRFSIGYFVAAIAGIFLLNFLVQAVQPKPELVSFSTFKQKIESGEIRQVEMSSQFYLGVPYGDEEQTDAAGPTYRTVPVADPSFVALLDEKQVEYQALEERSSPWLGFLLQMALLLLLLFVLWRFLFRRMGNMQGNLMGIGQNKARIVSDEDTQVRFKDVAGADEAKYELAEVVDFLKTPDKYTEIGGKIPKGVLLVGAPGTGKTLLAKAVAGEADVPFFRISGSEFVEMFVGVGAARVRDLFNQARGKAPCIIFIDELDAIGKSRLNLTAGNDEREQTLNQLLVEMDGFDSSTGVILLAATNRPEVLDLALLRPGRFDRQVLVDRPDRKGREAILKIHTEGVKLDGAVELSIIARMTPGFVGADLANIVNEAALLAVRASRKRVSQKDFEEAIEKTVAGLEKKDRLILPREREMIATHETGHALVAAFTPGADPVQKISIVPRGYGALGYTMQSPAEDRYLMTYEELLGKIDVFLGGRAAEEIVFNKISTGAANDLMQATEIAKKMITEYGMSKRFGNMVLNRQQAPLLGPSAEPGIIRDYSESTQAEVDNEIAELLEQRYQTVLSLLREKVALLKKIAARLLELETLQEIEFQSLLKVA